MKWLHKCRFYSASFGTKYVGLLHFSDVRGPSNWITFGSLDNMDVGIPMRFSFQTQYNGQSGVLWVFQLKGRIPKDWSQFTYLACIILKVCFRLCKCLGIQTANRIFAAHIRWGIQIMQTRKKQFPKAGSSFQIWKRRDITLLVRHFSAYLKSFMDLYH